MYCRNCSDDDVIEMKINSRARTTKIRVFYNWFDWVVAINNTVCAVQRKNAFNTNIVQKSFELVKENKNRCRETENKQTFIQQPFPNVFNDSCVFRWYVNFLAAPVYCTTELLCDFISISIFKFVSVNVLWASVRYDLYFSV